jgi:hypothetical protein
LKHQLINDKSLRLVQSDLSQSLLSFGREQVLTVGVVVAEVAADLVPSRDHLFLEILPVADKRAVLTAG